MLVVIVSCQCGSLIQWQMTTSIANAQSKTRIGLRDEEQGEGRRRGQTSSNNQSYILGKVHIHGRRDDPVVPGVTPVAPVIRSPAPDVVDHAAEEADLPPPRRAGRPLPGSTATATAGRGVVAGLAPAGQAVPAGERGGPVLEPHPRPGLVFGIHADPGGARGGGGGRPRCRRRHFLCGLDARIAALAVLAIGGTE